MKRKMLEFREMMKGMLEFGKRMKRKMYPRMKRKITLVSENSWIWCFLHIGFCKSGGWCLLPVGAREFRELYLPSGWCM
jgi:hypothetical protein